MADRLLINGQVVEIDPAAQRSRLAGLGVVAGDLAAAEAASWRRWLPGRLPWAELSGYEEEVGRLEHRRQENEARRAEVTERLRVAPEADLESLAAWERSGRSGPRPEPARTALESELERLQAEERGLLLAIDQVTADRASYVAEHRARLSRDAHRAAQEAHARTVGLLADLEAARAELVQARRLELWVLLYPSESAGREPMFLHLGGGLRRIIRSAFGRRSASSRSSLPCAGMPTGSRPQRRASR